MGDAVRAVRAALNADRTGIARADHPVWLACVVLPVTGTAYWWFFGNSVMASLDNIRGLDTPQVGGYLGPLNQWEVAAQYAWCLGVIVIMGVGAMALRMIHPSVRREHIPWHMRWFSFAMAYLVMDLAQWLRYAVAYAMLGLHLPLRITAVGSVTIGDFAAFLDLSWNVIGPLGEETILLAFLCIGLRRCGMPWWFIAVLSGALRVAFHLYQGWPAVASIVWAVAFVMIYRCTGSFRGIAAAHIAYDLVYALRPLDYAFVNAVCDAVALASAVIWLMVIRRGDLAQNR